MKQPDDLYTIDLEIPEPVTDQGVTERRPSHQDPSHLVGHIRSHLAPLVAASV